MLYLKNFSLPSRDADENFFSVRSETFKTKNYRTCYVSRYPFILFRERELPRFEFTDITIFCGNNGCGKSTILNVISEKLALRRTTAYNRSEFFDDYVGLCECKLAKEIPRQSAIITSDGVFDRVLDIRRLNDGIDDRRNELVKEYIAERGDETPNALRGLDDYDRWKRAADMRKRSATQSSFLRSNLVRNVEERSNGESALAFFVDAIGDDALYLLDEPENSLSPSNQLQLKYFIEDCVRNHGCQFVISTHSPFLLSLSHAKIYDLDHVPPETARWSELECVRVYKEFFDENADSFF